MVKCNITCRRYQRRLREKSANECVAAASFTGRGRTFITALPLPYSCMYLVNHANTARETISDNYDVPKGSLLTSEEYNNYKPELEDFMRRRKIDAFAQTLDKGRILQTLACLSPGENLENRCMRILPRCCQHGIGSLKGLSNARCSRTVDELRQRWLKKACATEPSSVAQLTGVGALAVESVVKAV
jgi:hypothetical protein